MAIVSRKVSDLSGKDGADAEFAAVVVRQYPGLDQPKALDVHVSEVEAFKDQGGDLVILEIRMPNGAANDIYMKVGDFNKLAPDMASVLQSARGTRGRVPGTRVGNGG